MHIYTNFCYRQNYAPTKSISEQIHSKWMNV